MSIQTLIHSFNWNFCYHAALAATDSVRAVLAYRAGQHDKLCEHIAAALMHLAKAVQSL